MKIPTWNNESEGPMTIKQKFEDAVRAYEDAKRTFDQGCRKWLAEQEPKPATEDEFKALERRYNVEHHEEVAALEALVTEVNVMRAELERRWIEAHEDLAILRRAAEGLGSLQERVRGG